MTTFTKAWFNVASSHTRAPMPITRYLLPCIGIVAFFLLGGCQTNKTPLDPIINSDPEKQLLGVAESIENSLKILAEARAEDIPPALNTEPLITPEGGMGRKADIDWSGPIEPFVQKISDLTEYHLKVFGQTPQVPVIISINAKNILLADALKDAGLQAGKRATIMVFPNSRVIEIRYARD